MISKFCSSSREDFGEAAEILELWRTNLRSVPQLPVDGRIWSYFLPVIAVMSQVNENESQLLTRAAANDATALNDLFALHRPRLKTMVRLRLHPLVRR